MAQTGSYLHDEANKAYLRFESHGDTPRVFTVLVADAFNANGLIGSEYNGLVILENGREDDSATFPILDRRHNYNKAAALREMEHLKTLSWSQFLDFVREAPEYRDNLQDLEELKFAEGREGYGEAAIKHIRTAPEPGNRRNLIAQGILDLADEPDIRPQELFDADANPDCPYDFPKIGREGIIAELSNHSWYANQYEKLHLEWNVKMHMSLDDTGKLEGGYPVDDAFDDRWKERFEADDFALQDQIIEDMRESYRDEYMSYTGDDQGDYEMAFYGRSGGHMVLLKMDGVDISAHSKSDIGDVLSEMSDDDLVKLWKVTRCLDHEITPEKLAAEWAYKLNFERNSWEEDLKAEAKAEKEAEEAAAEAEYLSPFVGGPS